jgi:hypothetical protein
MVEVRYRALSGTLANYVSGSSGDGDVAICVPCVRDSGSFYTSGALMRRRSRSSGSHTRQVERRVPARPGAAIFFGRWPPGSCPADRQPRDRVAVAGAGVRLSLTQSSYRFMLAPA